MIAPRATSSPAPHGVIPKINTAAENRDVLGKASHKAQSSTSSGLWLPHPALSPPFGRGQSHHKATLRSPRCFLPYLSGSQGSYAATKAVMRPFPSPLQAAAIDVPHKCILLRLPKPYRSFKRRHPLIAPKMTFAPFPAKLQHKLGLRRAAEGSSFVLGMLEEKNNCWLPISKCCSTMPKGLAPLCASLWTAIICYSPSQCCFIMACFKRAPLFRICSLSSMGKGGMIGTQGLKVWKMKRQTQ